MPQERIEVIFVAKGQRQVERSIVQMSKAADSLSKSADKAAKSIAQMGKSSGGTGKVSAGVQKAGRDVKRLGNDAQKTAGRVNSLWKSLTVPAATGASIRETGRAMNSLIGRFAAFYSGRLLVGISDEFGRMSNVLSGFGVAAGEIDKVRKSINKVANAARVDAVQAATLFGRLRQATKGLGLTSRDLVGIVGTVNKALRLGGASSLEASQSIRQLSQAFNKGKLDGDEFRSVMENAPILQDLLTEKLGVTKDALFDLAAQGKITARDLVGAFQEGADAIDEQFGKRIDTLGDALTVLKNEFREVFGTKVSGPANLLVQAIVKIADNMERLLNLLTAFAAIKIFSALAVKAAAFVATLSKAAVLMRSLASFGSRYGAGAALAVGARQIGLRGAASFIPVVGQIALVGYTLYEVADAFGLFGKSAKELAEEAEAASERMISAGRALAESEGRAAGGLSGLSKEDYRTLGRFYAKSTVRGGRMMREIESETKVQPTYYPLAGPGGRPSFKGYERVLSAKGKAVSVELDTLAKEMAKEIESLNISAARLLTAFRGAEPSGTFEKLPEELLAQAEKVLAGTVQKELSGLGFGGVVEGIGGYSDVVKEFGANSAEAMNAYRQFIDGVVSGIPQLTRSEVATELLAKEIKEIGKAGGQIDINTWIGMMTKLKGYQSIANQVLDPQQAKGTKADRAAVRVVELTRDLANLEESRKKVTQKFPALSGAFSRAMSVVREQIVEAEGGLSKLLSGTEKTAAAMSRLQLGAPGGGQGVLPAVEARAGRPAEGLPGDISGEFLIPAISEIKGLPERLGLSRREMLFLAQNSKVFEGVLSDISEKKKPLSDILDKIRGLMKAFADLAQARNPFEKIKADALEFKRSIDSNNATLRRMRENLKAIGKGRAELERAKFTDVINRIKGRGGYDEGSLSKEDAADLKNARDALKEFDSLAYQTGVRAVETTLEQETDKFIDGIRRFQEEAQRLQQAIPGLSPEEAAKAENAIQSKFESLQLEAVRFGELAGKNVGPAAQPFIDRIETAMIAAGDAIGVKVGAAFASAMLRGISSVVPGLEGLASGAFPSLFGANVPKGQAPTQKQTETARQVATELGTGANNAGNMADALGRVNQQVGLLGTTGLPQLKNLSSSAQNTANDIQQFFEGAFGSLEDALVGFVTTGKLDFKSLINSIIADLARMVIRMLIIKPLMGFFGGIFGFSGGGIVPGFKNGGVIPGYAPGGIVTGFGGARSDNQLAALSPGEMVINAASTRSNRGSLEYINKTGKMPPTRDGGSTVFAPSIVINQQGNDPEVTAQMVDAAVKRSWTELAVKSQRKGGVFDRRGG